MEEKPEPRLFYKPDATFKEDLIKGYFGRRVIQSILSTSYRHHLVPLEEWGESIEIVKDARLKRRRKTDLICKKCGIRIEVRAKTQDIVAMSDSVRRPFEKEHQDEDWVAFPIFKVSMIDRKEDEFRLQFAKRLELQKIYFVQIKELKRTKDLARAKKSGRGERFLVWKEGNRYNVLKDILTIDVVGNKFEPYLPPLECKVKK